MLVVPFFQIRIGVFNLGPGVLRWQEEISNEGTLFNYFATILEKSSAKIIYKPESKSQVQAQRERCVRLHKCTAGQRSECESHTKWRGTDTLEKPRDKPNLKL